MYFQESENIADKYPELHDLVEAIDGRIKNLGPGSIIVPEDWAITLQEDINQIKSVLSLLSEDGILEQETRIMCLNCENQHPLNDLEDAKQSEEVLHCSQCDTELNAATIERLVVYKVQAHLENPHKPKISPESTAEIVLHMNELDQAIPNGLIDDPFKRSPLLAEVSNKILDVHGKVFESFHFMLLLHFLTDFIPFVCSLERLGMQPSASVAFYKRYRYPQRNSICEWMKERGYRVDPMSEIPQYLVALKDKKADNGLVIVLEDGGHISPRIHEHFSDLSQTIKGCVEQTTRGIMNMNEWLNKSGGAQLEFPILSVASCSLKRDFEPPHVAEAVIRNINDLLPAISIRGSKVAILGYGSIGKEIAKQLVSNGANVIVFDPDAQRKLEATQQGFNFSDQVEECVRGKSIVIGCSGSTSINRSALRAMDHGTKVVSASSETYEVTLDDLDQISSKKENLVSNGKLVGTRFFLRPRESAIDLIANGYPVNFWGFHSMKDPAADLILTLILLGALDIATNNKLPPGIDDSRIDQLAKEYEVVERFNELYQN